MREDQSRTRQYELMTIFSPDVSEEDLQGAIDHVTGIIGEAGGSVSLINRESPWGRRRLSYPIRHGGRDVRDGFYVLYYADLDAGKVTDVERDLKLTDNVMRYMVTQQVGAQMIPPSQLEAEAAAEDAEDAHAEEAAASLAAAAAAANEPVIADGAPTEESAVDVIDESETEDVRGEVEAGE